MYNTLACRMYNTQACQMYNKNVHTYNTICTIHKHDICKMHPYIISSVAADQCKSLEARKHHLTQQINIIAQELNIDDDNLQQPVQPMQRSTQQPVQPMQRSTQQPVQPMSYNVNQQRISERIKDKRETGFKVGNMVRIKIDGEKKMQPAVINHIDYDKQEANIVMSRAGEDIMERIKLSQLEHRVCKYAL